MRRAGHAAHNDAAMDREALRAFVDACQILVGRVDTIADDESAEVLRDLLVRLLRRRSRAPDPPPPTNFRVTRVLAYLEEEFADTSLKLTSAAAHVDVTPSHLVRLLKEHTGQTFLQHLRGIRMRHAERVLLTTAASIKETAYACGYASTSSFGRDFRRTHECPPREWREIRTLCNGVGSRGTAAQSAGGSRQSSPD
jgi:two-component system response regulator YesN